MAHINLLPWREELRQERQKNFIILMVSGFIFASAILYAVIMYFDGLTDEQNRRNSFLKSQIAIVDAKIKEIDQLEAEKTSLEARMQVIQDLQASRPKVVKVLDALARVVPDGVHLESMSREGNKINLAGVAESNARVSVFMNKIDENTEFDEANLQIIKKSGGDGVTKHFTMNANESKPNKKGEEN
jgi:type IV pilus assembly protein PilN